ncbi:MAG: response regulator, partial [Thermodesulfovibrionales bacterium]|nr:response regulator [Thermodesulfovibrionales bacterium]
MRILLIEDDRILGETLKDYLAIHEIETVWLWDERELPKVIRNYEFDVIVIDLILKFSSGEKIISTLRKAGFNTPIMVITAKRGMNDKEVCFTEGADDYLTTVSYTHL